MADREIHGNTLGGDTVPADSVVPDGLVTPDGMPDDMPDIPCDAEGDVADDLEARMAASEAAIADITIQLRTLLKSTIPAFDGRVSRHRGEIERLKGRATQLTDDLTRTRHERRSAIANQQGTRTAMEGRLNRHRGDIEGLKNKKGVDASSVDPLLAELRELHSGVSPIMHDLKILADAATDDQKKLARVDTHAGAISNLQRHLLDLQHRAGVLENRVGQRLRLAQTDPRLLLDSCQDHIATLGSKDVQWRRLFADFHRALSERDRVISTKLTVDFPVVSMASLEAISRLGFLAHEYAEIVAQYGHVSSRGGVREHQELLAQLVLIASRYPEDVWNQLKEIFQGVYVTIDQDLLAEFSANINSFLRDTIGPDYMVAIAGDPNQIHHIPASHAPMRYVLNVPLPERSMAPKYKHFFPSGFVFYAPDDDRHTVRPCPPGIRIIHEDDGTEFDSDIYDFASRG